MIMNNKEAQAPNSNFVYFMIIIIALFFNSVSQMIAYIIMTSGRLLLNQFFTYIITFLSTI